MLFYGFVLTVKSLCLYNNSGFGGSCGPFCFCQRSIVAFMEGDYREGLGIAVTFAPCFGTNRGSP